MFVYVVEGPAGSGKSTICQKQLEDWPEAVMLDARPVGEKVRSYPGNLGMQMSFDKDLTILGQLITFGQPDSVILIDRWILSSFVYDWIRGETDLPDQFIFNKALFTWISALAGFTQSFTARGRTLPKEIQINWMLNIPVFKELESRRAQASKAYPYPADRELVGYTQIEILIERFISHVQLPEGIEMYKQNISNGQWAW